MTCKEERKKTVSYFGESARTSYDRGSEHWKAWKNREKDSVLTLHREEALPECLCSYQMNIVNSHRLPIFRQADEAIMISRFEGENLMNRKGKW